MRDDVAEMMAKIRESQHVKITNGPLTAVLEGRMHVVDAMREAARRPADTVQGEHRDTSAYDPVLRWHTRT